MRFRTYMIFDVVLYAILILLFGAIFISIAPALGIAFIVILVVVGIPVLLIDFTLLSGRLDDYGGQYPMPVLWGLLGVDLVDDDYDPSTEGDAGDGGPTLEGFGEKEEPELDAYGNPISHQYHCAYCSAPLRTPTSKFCSECGRPVVPVTPRDASGSTVP